MASTSAHNAAYETEDQLTYAPQILALCPSISAAPSLTTSSQSAKPGNAFEGLAPSSSTCVASTEPVKKLPYDVFINHRGPDVKKELATDLYNTLTGMGLRVFLDSEELELGDFLPREIEEAMRSASLHVAIFSRNYAESPWCLAELSFMLKTGTQIVPVFYHIDPADVRYAKGVYAEAFSWYAEKGRFTPEKLQEWKKALSNVSYNVGHIIHTKNDEMKLLRNIVNCAVKVIKNVPFVVAKHPVGIDEAVKDFELTALQSVKGHPTVQIVGIWGMGGLGKTTLAKKLYNNKYKTMERCSFLLDVRDAAHRSVLHIKQKKLLEDLGVNDVKVDNIEEGKGILARHLRSVRVLIVLDDVDSVDQLDALVPEKDNLRRGSLIIVTTRQFDVLRSWGISSSSVYKMKRLDPSHCEQLFCWHAFLQSFPKDGFANIVEKFVGACDGLPLSLKVFGGQLYGKPEQDYWKSQLEKIARILPDDVKNRLKVSYDALDNEEKEAFLDAACFLIGEEKSLVIEVWNGSKGSGLCSWDTLLNRCLIEVDEMDCLSMHDHLRDLGREISNQQSPHRLWFPRTGMKKNPNQLSSLCLCFPQSSIKVEKKVEIRSNISIRGIMATSTRLMWHPASRDDIQYRYRIMVELDGASRQDRKFWFNTGEGIVTLSPSLGGLKFIVVRGHNLDQVIGGASRELVWLRWFPDGQRNLPSRLSLKNLRVLEIYEEKDYGDHHLQELWKDANDAPIQLRELVVSGCSEFQRFPKSIGSLKYLKKIVVEHNKYLLKSLPRDFCLLQSLEHLKLYCQLSSLPENFGDLRNLRYLYLSGFLELRRLPISFKGLTLLQHLHLEGFFELTLDSDIMEDMTKLEYCNLFACKKLEELPRHITNQPFLTQLHLSTESLRELPVNIGQLSKLQKLTIHSKLLTSLPTSLGDLSSLTSLELRECPKLESLPDSLGDLSSLTTLVIYDSEKLESLPDSLGRLSLLEKLKINGSRVKTLSRLVRELINLQELYISGCPIREFDLGSSPFPSPMWNFKRIALRVTQVFKISISEDSCPGLEVLNLKQNYHLAEIQVLPTTVKDIKVDRCKMLRNIGVIDGLVNIQKLSIIGCPKLEALPSFAQFASLQEFELNSCDGIRNIQGLEHWTALEELTGERLRRLQLIAIRRSVIEPYIQTMKKWPEEEIVVCVRALPDAASLVYSAFQRLSIGASLENRKIDRYHQCKLVPKWSPNGDAIIVCFVINCITPRMLLEFRAMHAYPHLISETELEEGKWVWLAIFTQHSMWWRENEYNIGCPYEDELGRGKVERALVGVGKHDRVLEAFCHLWERLPE